jgi:hypothetical protein
MVYLNFQRRLGALYGPLILLMPPSYCRVCICGRGQLKCDGTRAETRFRLSAKRTSPFKSAGASVQSTIVSRGVRISGSNAGYTIFRGSVKGTGYPLHSLVSPSLPLPCVTVCQRISIGVYYDFKPLYVVASSWDLNPSIIEGSTTLPATGER